MKWIVKTSEGRTYSITKDYHLCSAETFTVKTADHKLCNDTLEWNIKDFKKAIGVIKRAGRNGYVDIEIIKKN